MQQWDLRQKSVGNELMVQRCCKVIWVSIAKTSRVFVSCQLTPGICRAQLVQTEHSHHRGFLRLKVSHRGEGHVGLSFETHKDESGHVTREPPHKPRFRTFPDRRLLPPTSQLRHNRPCILLRLPQVVSNKLLRFQLLSLGNDLCTPS